MFNKIEKHLATLNHNDKLAFALYCVKYCYKYNNDATRPAVDNIIGLIEAKLKGVLITDKQFHAAANAAAYAEHDKAYQELYNALINGTYKKLPKKNIPKEAI